MFGLELQKISLFINLLSKLLLVCLENLENVGCTKGKVKSDACWTMQLKMFSKHFWFYKKFKFIFSEIIKCLFILKKHEVIFQSL